jgi:hypothetical protein
MEENGIASDQIRELLDPRWVKDPKFNTFNYKLNPSLRLFRPMDGKFLFDNTKYLTDITFV